MRKGFLCIILHAHLPYVRHPEYDQFFEENWLFEAITECYIPLLRSLETLQQDNVRFRLTLSLSPTLISMLVDPLLQSRYIRHLQRQIELSEKEIIRTHNDAELRRLSHWYHELFQDTLEIYLHKHDCDLLKAFKSYHDAGFLELITCSATHGFLPLLNVSEAAVRNQIEVGVDTFSKYLGFQPAGFWLPECAYYPGLEEILKKTDIGYFFIDTHGIENASAAPVDGVYAPLNCGNDVFAFARDPESSRQVWSSIEGYPGDGDYREYYKDIGFDLDEDYLEPYMLDGHIRVNTGIKYHRVTGGDQPKELYNPHKANEKTKLHARDFINKRQQQVNQLSTAMQKPPIIVSPYDAELFGHWWFEGPQWLASVLRFADNPGNGVTTVSCSDYLKQNNNLQIAVPSASSWGHQGYSEFWVNENNDWIYPHLHKAAADMEKLAYDFQQVTVKPLQERALNQAVRSLLLAQSSDWPFIMQTGTTVEYANKRVTDHLARFNYLTESIRKNAINEQYLCALEILDDIFPDVDFRNYSVQ